MLVTQCVQVIPTNMSHSHHFTTAIFSHAHAWPASAHAPTAHRPGPGLPPRRAATHCVVWSRQNLLIRNWNKLLRLKRGSEVFHDTIAAQMIKLQFIVNYIEQRRLFFSVWYGFQEIFPWETTTSYLLYEFLFGMHYKTGSRKKRNNVNPM